MNSWLVAFLVSKAEYHPRWAACCWEEFCLWSGRCCIHYLHPNAYLGLPAVYTEGWKFSVRAFNVCRLFLELGWLELMKSLKIKPQSRSGTFILSQVAVIVIKISYNTIFSGKYFHKQRQLFSLNLYLQHCKQLKSMNSPYWLYFLKLEFSLEKVHRSLGSM